MAGAFLSIGSCMSALSKNQVIAFIACGVICLLFILAGFPLVLNVFKAWLPAMVIDTVASLSFLTHFNSISKGVLSVVDVLYFFSLVVTWLIATAIVVEIKQAS
jgi:ABC-2 type transport system permease protein